MDDSASAVDDLGLPADVQADVAIVGRISAVPSILEVVCQATGMGFAAVTRVTEDRWIACKVLDLVQFGLVAGSELPIKTTLCDEVRASNSEIVIDDVQADALYASHHTPQIYGLQSYISVPINLADGSFFGTLCAIDAKPAQLKGTHRVGMVRLFAQMIGRHIDDQRLLAQSQTRLAESLETAQLREQFISILGHDLRNPLASLQAGTRLLLRAPESEKAIEILLHMELTTARMKRLIDDMLHLARGGLSGGIDVKAHDVHSLCATLEQIVTEIKVTHPLRAIELTQTIDCAIPADLSRLGQLFSNLIGNAVAYGADSQPIRIHASTGQTHFEFSVANAGDPIPPATLSRLFQPFFRGAQQRHTEGLGLGLYIAAQIAEAHNGQLTAHSDEKATIFTFKMPLEFAESDS
jgi:signal transduction histidine kinase